MLFGMPHAAERSGRIPMTERGGKSAGYLRCSGSRQFFQKEHFLEAAVWGKRSDLMKRRISGGVLWGKEEQQSR